MERAVVKMVFDWLEPMWNLNLNRNCREKAAVKMDFD